MFLRYACQHLPNDWLGGSLPLPLPPSRQSFAKENLDSMFLGCIVSFQKIPDMHTRQLFRAIYSYTVTCCLGEEIKTEAWILRRLVTTFAQVTKRPHIPRDRQLRKLLRQLALTSPRANLPAAWETRLYKNKLIWNIYVSPSPKIFINPAPTFPD